MNKKLNIKNSRFELVDSTLKGYKEVEVLFNCNGSDYKYFIFVKEGKNVNYINEAKRQFDKDLASGKVLKSIKGGSTNPHPWLIAGASILGVAALTLAGLFTWKMVTNNNSDPGPEPTPTKTYTVTFNANGGTYAETSSETVTRENVIYNTMPDIPEDPTRASVDGIKAYIFTGYDKNVMPVTGDVTNITYTAQWKETTNVYTLNVSATSEGAFPDKDTTKSITLAAGTNILNSIAYLSKPIFNTPADLKIFDKYVYENGNEIGSEDTIKQEGVTIKATYRTLSQKTLEKCSWNEIATVSYQGKDFAKAYFGEIDRDEPITKTVMVNNQPHTVRIIGYGEDYTELPKDGGTPDPSKAIGITFEFANFISDENGHSIATQWNDTKNADTANHNYRKSSIRYALNRETDEGGYNHILWAQKGETTWSADYKNKCVLDMLPSELVSVLKTPSKYINIYNTATTQYEEKTVNDKLFLLSPKEMGNTVDIEYEEEHTTTYSYYENATDNDRVKKQVNIEDVYGTEQEITYNPDSGQVYDGIVYNAAGYNDSVEASRGGFPWLRSPCATADNTGSQYAWLIGIGGGILPAESNNFVYNRAFAVAPAFCI